jgi:hypothetical protein
MCKTCDDAWAAFEAWLAQQSDDVQELSLPEQIELYAKQTR